MDLFLLAVYLMLSGRTSGSAVRTSKTDLFFLLCSLAPRRLVGGQNEKQHDKNNNKHIGRSTLKLAILENVPKLACAPIEKITRKKLGPSNLDVVVYMFESDGFFCCVFLMEPTHFGIPQTRTRLYVLVIHFSQLSMTGPEAA